MSAETRTDLTGRIEQTPPQIADQAWRALGLKISPRTIRAVIMAELAYAKSLRTPDEPMSEGEGLLQKAIDFRHRSGREAALRFFDRRLETALQADPFDIGNKHRVQTLGNVVSFIQKSIQVPAPRH